MQYYLASELKMFR